MKTEIISFIAFILLFCMVSDAADIFNMDSASGIGYYKAEYANDTIPSTIEAGTTYPVTISFHNAGMVSWEWGVEKFGMLYQGLQSSIGVDPEFSQIPEGVKVLSQEDYTFSLKLTPPEKPGEYNVSFSMATRKGEGKYETFPNSFTKKVYVISRDGVSSGAVGSIIVTTEPEGAVVMLGSEEKGKTPLTLPDLNPATYEITISHPDYSKKWVKVKVEPASVSRISANLSSSDKPDQTTERLMKFTPIGWIIDNIPLILITVVIGFLALQVAMMDTKHVPENHPVRVFTRPITIFKPSDGKAKSFKRGRERGGEKTGGGETGPKTDISDKRDQKITTDKGRNTKKSKEVEDRKESRQGDEKPNGTIEEEPEKELELLPDPFQEIKDLDSTWGFPHSLRDKYEPLGMEGDDSYARIFKVRKKASGEIRALKLAHMKEEGSEILQKETAVWRSLRHPHIIRVFRSEFLDNQTYLEDEYMKGVSYHGERYTSAATLPKPIKKEYAISISRDVALGLSYAHETGVRHYHIQPGVILLNSKLRAKLSGFARGKNELGFSIPDSEIKEAKAVYIAPEQRDEKRYGNPGRRTDIYQLGVVFYELLTGFLPYTKEAFEKAGRTGSFEEKSDELVLPSEIRPGLLPLDPIIKKMLSKEKSGRYYLVDELLTDLEVMEGRDRQDKMDKDRSES